LDRPSHAACGNGEARWFAIRGGSRLVWPSPQCHFCGVEIVFSVTQEADGGFVAECLSHDIFTQGDTWDALRANVEEAVRAFFFDQPKPARIRLHWVRDEVLAC
jgi:predicted RNase H-like HicB family nuclease